MFGRFLHRARASGALGSRACAFCTLLHVREEERERVTPNSNHRVKGDLRSYAFALEPPANLVN